MNKKYLLLPLFIMFIVSYLPMAFADLTYPNLGGDDFTYRTGDGRFNLDNDGISQTAVRSLSNPVMAPLVNDLDGNGLNEIIVFEGSTISIFRGTTLTPVTAITLTNQSLDLSILAGGDMITFDIDGDGKKEVIVTSDNTGNIDILDYDNDTFTHKKNLKIPSTYHHPYNGAGTPTYAGQIKLACTDTDECIAVYTSEGSYEPYNNATVLPFTSSAVGTEFRLHDPISTVRTICMSDYGGITVADYDKDNDDEFIFNVAFYSGNGIHTIFYGTTDGSVFNLEQTINNTDLIDGSAGAFDKCTGEFGRFISSPLVAEIKGGAGSQLETVIAQQVEDTTNSFRMYSYSANGNLIRQYPNVQTATGQLLGNVFLMNAYGDENKDFCTMGYYNVSPSPLSLDLLCASETTTLFSLFNIFNVSSEEFVYNLPSGTVFFQDTNSLVDSALVHSGDHDQTVWGDRGTNNDEIITPYGVFALEFDEVSFLTFLPQSSAQSRLVQLVPNLQNKGGVMVPVDASSSSPNNPLSDLLFMTDNNLFYFDDGFSNSQAYISDYSINPCINSVWKINTTVEVSYTVVDIDGDSVRASSTLYQGLSNEQVQNQSSYFNSGTIFPFQFTANQTVANGVLRMTAQDDVNNLSLFSEDFSFSVANNGVEFGDCVTTGDLSPVTTDLNGDVVFGDGELNTEENAVKSAVRVFTGSSGLGDTVVWLIIMVAVSLGIWFATASHGGHTLGALGIVNFLMVILGTLFGFFNTGIVISIVIVSLAVIVVFVWRGLTGGGN